MSQPLVLCVMLANGRPEMVERAVQSFRAQTYPDKELLVYVSGLVEPGQCDGPDIHAAYLPESATPIGTLRNYAAEYARQRCLEFDLIAHWDSDDFSHPDRLTEQVRLIQQTGADCVGYNEMLFWDATKPEGCGVAGAWARGQQDGGEAWLYRNPNPAYCIGTSLLYTRAIWQRFPFPDCHVGEDTRWLLEKRIKRVAVTAMYGCSMSPRMIASIHGGNTSSAIQPGAREWKRAAEFDSYCREAMRL